MISGWLTSCGLRSTALRDVGYFPHSRLFTTQADFAVSKETAFAALKGHGFHHQIILRGTNRLRETTGELARYLKDADVPPFKPWLTITVDRKRKKTVVFAFQELNDAVRAGLILEDGEA